MLYFLHDKNGSIINFFILPLLFFWSKFIIKFIIIQILSYGGVQGLAL